MNLWIFIKFIYYFLIGSRYIPLITTSLTPSKSQIGTYTVPDPDPGNGAVYVPKPLKEPNRLFASEECRIYMADLSKILSGNLSANKSDLSIGVMVPLEIWCPKNRTFVWNKEIFELERANPAFLVTRWKVFKCLKCWSIEFENINTSSI